MDHLEILLQLITSKSEDIFGNSPRDAKETVRYINSIFSSFPTSVDEANVDSYARVFRTLDYHVQEDASGDHAMYFFLPPYSSIHGVGMPMFSLPKEGGDLEAFVEIVTDGEHKLKPVEFDQDYGYETCPESHGGYQERSRESFIKSLLDKVRHQAVIPTTLIASQTISLACAGVFPMMSIYDKVESPNVTPRVIGNFDGNNLFLWASLIFLGFNYATTVLKAVHSYYTQATEPYHR